MHKVMLGSDHLTHAEAVAADRAAEIRHSPWRSFYLDHDKQRRSPIATAALPLPWSERKSVQLIQANFRGR